MFHGKYFHTTNKANVDIDFKTFCAAFYITKL